MARQVCIKDAAYNFLQETRGTRTMSDIIDLALQAYRERVKGECDRCEAIKKILKGDK